MNLLNAIFSTSFGFSVLRVTTPIIFAAMAALITNKAGVMNIALEAIMLFGAFFGTVVSAWTQNAFFGVLAAIGCRYYIVYAYGILCFSNEGRSDSDWNCSKYICVRKYCIFDVQGL